MGALYVSIILLCRVVQHLLNKRTSAEINTFPRFFKYGVYRNLLSGLLGLILILIEGNGFSINLPTLFISLLSGLMLASSTVLSVLSLKNGTVALSSMFATAGLLVPCFAGIFLFNEPMSIWQWFGVLLFFVAAYFLISSSSKIYNGFSAKTLLILIGVMLAEGFTMLSQQAFSFYVADGDVSTFSFLAFTFAGIFTIPFCFIKPNAPLVNTGEDGEGEDGKNENSLSKNLLIYGSILSVAVFIINQLATLAVPLVEPVVLFTFINGGSTIIGAIVASIFFKEKFTVKSVVGVTLGVVALIIIKAL